MKQTPVQVRLHHTKPWESGWVWIEDMPDHLGRLIVKKHGAIAVRAVEKNCVRTIEESLLSPE